MDFFTIPKKTKKSVFDIFFDFFLVLRQKQCFRGWESRVWRVSFCFSEIFFVLLIFHDFEAEYNS